MRKIAVFSALVGASLGLSATANATSYQDQIDLCAAAINDQGLASVDEYRVKFLSASSSRLNVKLVPLDDGETLVAECKIRRGKVSSVTLKS